jgi:hypothetical protein
MWEDKLMDTFAAIACPILLVPARGAEPNAFTSAKEAAVVKASSVNARVRVHWIESIHDVPLYEPDELARVIGEFASDL